VKFEAKPREVMAKIIKTEGVCLASQRIGETSKLVTVFTKDHGKLMLLAKGARLPKSRLGGALEIFTHCEIIFYASEKKVIYTLSSADIKEIFPSLKSISKFITAYQVIEAALRVTKLEDPNFKFYNLLLTTLRILDHLKETYWEKLQVLLGGYYLKAIDILGFRPELYRCVLCGSQNLNYFSISAGGAICSRSKHLQLKNKDLWPSSHLKILRFLLKNPLITIINSSLPDDTYNLIKQYFLYYLEAIPQEKIDYFLYLKDIK
jgi:DNA repair protein RecO (recombination protein O)